MASNRPMTDVTTIWKFGLGDEAKDSMTGFQGVVAARIEFLDGCRRYLLQSQKPNKETQEAGPERNVDEGLMVLVKARKVVVVDKMPPADKYHPVPGGPKNGERTASQRASHVSSASR